MIKIFGEGIKGRKKTKQKQKPQKKKKKEIEWNYLARKLSERSMGKKIANISEIWKRSQSC